MLPKSYVRSSAMYALVIISSIIISPRPLFCNYNICYYLHSVEFQYFKVKYLELFCHSNSFKLLTEAFFWHYTGLLQYAILELIMRRYIFIVCSIKQTALLSLTAVRDKIETNV